MRCPYSKSLLPLTTQLPRPKMTSNTPTGNPGWRLRTGPVPAGPGDSMNLLLERDELDALGRFIGGEIMRVALAAKRSEGQGSASARPGARSAGRGRR